MNTSKLTPAERLILRQLGGRRWTVKRYRPNTVTAARTAWAALRTAVGFTTPGGWMTTERTNPKLAKSGLPTAGVTLHAARNALSVWAALEAAKQAALAAALGVAVSEIDAGLRATVCPRSTESCREACVVAHSANGELPRSQRARLARTLFTLFRPADALALTASALDKLRIRHGRRNARWRVNISDDIRWELLAPGLFAVAPRAYTYTKWNPAERPGRPGLRIVYSASEHTTGDAVVNACKNDQRVAVVFDVRKRLPLPATWHGVPVVDGDKTDDLYRHPAGAIVGLRAKGTIKQQEDMRTSKFAKPATPTPATPSATVVPLPVRRKATKSAGAMAA